MMSSTLVVTAWLSNPPNKASSPPCCNCRSRWRWYTARWFTRVRSSVHCPCSVKQKSSAAMLSRRPLTCAASQGSLDVVVVANRHAHHHRPLHGDGDAQRRRRTTSFGR